LHDSDPRIGKTLPVVAKHHGHTVEVIRRDIEKHRAYWLRCSCGVETLMGEHWLDRAIERGSVAHGAVSQRSDFD
jgi:hypothetical protein